MSQLEPTTQAFIDSLAGAKPLYTLTPVAARDVLAGAQKSVSVALAPARSDDRVLNVGPKGRTNIRIYRPENAKGTLPVVIYTHGGGWVLGDRETHDRLVRELTVGANAVVVFVDYDRSPESHYPVAVEESYAVLKYVAEHPDEFGADASRIAIAGDSVGGNMTAVVALLAKERNGPAVKAQLLFYPATDASMSTGSYKEFAEGPWLTKRRWNGSGINICPTFPSAPTFTSRRSTPARSSSRACPKRCSWSTRTTCCAMRARSMAASSLQLAFRSGRSATMAQSMISCCSTRSRTQPRCVVP